MDQINSTGSLPYICQPKFDPWLYDVLSLPEVTSEYPQVWPKKQTNKTHTLKKKPILFKYSRDTFLKNARDGAFPSLSYFQTLCPALLLPL